MPYQPHPADPAVRRSPVVDGVDTTTTGVKLSYTVPAGGSAKLLSASWFNNAGTPTVKLQILRGAATIVLRQDAASFRESIPTTLLDGDVVQLNVTVGGTTSNADAQLSIEEYPNS